VEIRAEIVLNLEKWRFNYVITIEL